MFFCSSFQKSWYCNFSAPWGMWVKFSYPGFHKVKWLLLSELEAKLSDFLNSLIFCAELWRSCVLERMSEPAFERPRLTSSVSVAAYFYVSAVNCFLVFFKCDSCFPICASQVCWIYRWVRGRATAIACSVAKAERWLLAFCREVLSSNAAHICAGWWQERRRSGCAISAASCSGS